MDMFFSPMFNDHFGHLNLTEMIDPWLHHHVRLRMNAKSWGPLWHILPEEKETPVFEKFYRHPVMMLGINIYQTPLGRRLIREVYHWQPYSHENDQFKYVFSSLSLSVKCEYGFTDINI